ncbi:hypothetical protein Efla_005691 [Eimeria flavescens]
MAAPTAAPTTTAAATGAAAAGAANVFPFAAEAFEAPFNAAAVVAVDFIVEAEREALPCLHAFCLFMGKTTEAAPLASWALLPRGQNQRNPINKASDSPAAAAAAGAGEGGGEEGKSKETVFVKAELQLPSFSVPPSACESLARESLSFVFVKTNEPLPEKEGGALGGGGPRKEAQSRSSGRQEGNAKAGKKNTNPKTVLPQGDSRTAEMKAGILLLLKEGETIAAPEQVHKTLSTLPGIVSCRCVLRAATPLLSPSLRWMLNPVWLCLKEVRFLPLLPSQSSFASSSFPIQKQEAPVAAEAPPPSPDSGHVPAPPYPRPAPAAAAAGAVVATAGCSSREAAKEECRSLYLARFVLFSQVYETAAKAEEAVAAGERRVEWNLELLSFWGPAAINQNRLRDFLEEEKLQVEVYRQADEEGAAFAAAEPELLAALAATSSSRWKEQKAPLTQATKTRGPMARAKRMRAAANGSKKQTEQQQLLLPPNRSRSGSSNNNSSSSSSVLSVLKPPHGIACFRLNALSSCHATSLCLSTDVLPAAGYTLRKGEGEKSAFLSRTNGPDFLKMGTVLTLSLRLAEPLFQPMPLVLFPSFSSESGNLSNRRCTPAAIQKMNRLFLVASLGSPLASEALEIAESENKTIKELTEKATQSEEEKEGKEEDDFLTGFILEDGECMYSVLEGFAGGKLAKQAENLLKVRGEVGEGKEKVLYNSLLRFSERKYPLNCGIRKLKLPAPLSKVACGWAAFPRDFAGNRLFSSAISKLQMSTFFTRAADLKITDLFLSNAELQAISTLRGD